MAALKSQFARSSIELRKKKKQNRKPDLRPGRIVAYCSNIVFAVCFLRHRCNPAHLNHTVGQQVLSLFFSRKNLREISFEDGCLSRCRVTTLKRTAFGTTSHKLSLQQWLAKTQPLTGITLCSRAMKRVTSSSRWSTGHI